MTLRHLFTKKIFPKWMKWFFIEFVHKICFLKKPNSRNAIVWKIKIGMIHVSATKKTKAKYNIQIVFDNTEHAFIHSYSFVVFLCCLNKRNTNFVLFGAGVWEIVSNHNVKWPAFSSPTDWEREKLMESFW